MNFFRFHWIVKAVMVTARFLGRMNQPNSTPIVSGLPFLVSQMFASIQRVIVYGGIDSKVKFDQWLELVDSSSPADITGLALFEGVPANVEEAIFDHLIVVARMYGYHLLEVPWPAVGGDIGEPVTGAPPRAVDPPPGDDPPS